MHLAAGGNQLDGGPCADGDRGALPRLVRAVQRERFIVIVTFLQIATYIATYFVTPNDVTWHIMTSWQRLTRQVQLPITVVCVMLLAQFVSGGEDAPHAEARSDL